MYIIGGNQSSGAHTRRAMLDPRGSKAAFKMRTMICPQHGATPEITTDGGAVHVVTCCETFKKDVLLALAEVMRTTH